MKGLSLIWIAALVMIGLAIGWMIVLIVARLIRQRSDLSRAVDRRAVMRAFMELQDGDGDGPRRLKPYVGRARLMAECILELQGVVRGADQLRVLDALRAMGVARLLTQRLARGSKAGRLLSLEALATLGGDEAQAAMTQAIGSPEAAVRIYALKGLVQSGAPPSVGALLDLAGDGGVARSGIFVEVLREVVAQDADQALRAMERPDLTPALRLMLLDALGSSGAYQALPVLIAAAASPEAGQREAAVRGLGRLQHPSGAQALAACLEDPAWTVRAAAAEAVGAAGLPRLAGKVGELLADSEWWVRFRAGAALHQLGPAGLDELTFIARHGGDVERRAAELAMAEAG